MKTKKITAKRGAPEGNRHAAKPDPMTGKFPPFWHHERVRKLADELAEERGISLAVWLREAVDEKINREFQ